MTLEEANQKFLNKECFINWGTIGNNKRKGETVPKPIKVKVIKIVEWFDINYQKTIGLSGLMFYCEKDIYMPIEVERLTLA